MDYRELIKQHEGFSPMVYSDTLGNLTVGWGHAFLESPRPASGAIFSLKQCIAFFEDDMQQVERDYVWLEEMFDLYDLDYVRRGVLKNMIFNLGIKKLLKFKKMLAAVEKGDWKKASREMLDSRWAKQVKRRAIELARMMETGVWLN